MKTQKIKLSRTYVNEHGQLVKDYNAIEKVGIRARRMFKVLPFMVSFILCALLIMQVFCLIGLTKTVMNPTNTGDLGIYMFLCISISMICTLGFGIGWFLAEEVEQKTDIQTNQSNHKSLNDEFDIWQN